MVINLFLITLGAVTSIVAYRSGAPERACQTLAPYHDGTSPQEDSAPYIVSAVKNGDKIEIKISSPSGDEFKGFILQARSADFPEKFIPGEFTNDNESQGLNCHGVEKGTLTHVNNDLKREVKTEWIGTTDEDVIFRATVVKEYTTFWENIDSNPVRITMNKNSEYHGCFQSKGCFGMPQKCVEEKNCEVLLTYKGNDEGGIKFTLHGELNETEYMAMGVSEDAKMGNDFVTACIRDSDEIKLRKSWNEGYTNTGSKDVAQFHSIMSDGLVTCVWNDTKVLEFNGKTYDLTKNPHILLAHGPLKDDGELGYHSSKLPSADRINLFAYDPQSSTVPPTPKVTTQNPSCCSKLNSGLIWLAVFGAFYAAGRSMLGLV